MTRVLAVAAAAGLCAAGCGEPAGQRTPIKISSVSASPSASPAAVSPRVGGSSSPSPGPPPGSSSNPSPGPSSDSFAEGTQPSAGPLVFLRVIDWVGETQVTVAKATFHLTEHCAYLYGAPDEPMLLVWPAGQAQVDPAVPSTVQFREPASGMLRHLTDGQQVSLSGYPIAGTKPRYDPPPHPSCPSNGNHLAVQEVL